VLLIVQAFFSFSLSFSLCLYVMLDSFAKSTIQGAPKSKPLPNYQKNCITSY